MVVYEILSPVTNPCEEILIWFVVVLIPVELNPIGLTKEYPVFSSNSILTEELVPIPTDKFGFTDKLILSPIFKLCEVETETFATFFSTSTSICS